MDYEFTLVFDLDIKHNASASKDRTSLYMGKPEFKISVETGQHINTWCNQTSFRIPSNEDILQRVNECKLLDELLMLYNQYPDNQQALHPEFTKKRHQLLLQNNDTKIIA